MSQAASKQFQPTPDEVIPESAYRERMRRIAERPEMAEHNITLTGGAGASMGLLVAGLASVLLVVVGAFVVGLKHAVAAWTVGSFSVLACCLGSMFFVMVFHAINAGWSVTLRRQFENIARLVWVPWLMLVPVVVIEVFSHGVMLSWLDPAHASNPLLEHKAGFLNAPFFVVRFLVYGAIWTTLSFGLYHYSREQDRTGDRDLTRRARRMSCWGLPVFALTTAFAAFDFLMSPDFRFFSTMWGVFYFAGSAFSSLGMVALVIALLQMRGKLTGVVTAEHSHDLGKLMFAFTVFWAYIGFSQYFLIWYSNVPEETAWFIVRREHGWENLGVALIFLHFVVPFFLLVLRPVKRSVMLLGLFGVFFLFVQVLDMTYVLRPLVYLAPGAGEAPGPQGWFFDLAGAVGAFSLFGFMLTRAIASGPLIPTRDPRLDEALAHRNYV